MALIPARGGSRGVPGKNLRTVGGKSLVDRAISAALEAEEISDVVVSSDSEKILLNAEVPGVVMHLRHQEAASDDARSEHVIYEFLNANPLSLEPEDWICYLQPTAPFRTAVHVDAAFRALFTSGHSALVSVTEVEQYPEKMMVDCAGGSLRYWSDAADPGGNRQRFERRWYPTGGIYIFQVASFEGAKSIPVLGAMPFHMDKISSLDIDILEDLMIAEAVASYAGL